jgi:hypothetical protein
MSESGIPPISSRMPPGMHHRAQAEMRAYHSEQARGYSKGQTSMILIVLLLVIFAALAVFLMSMVRTVSQDEYMNLYVNNLMLSIMRADTGYSDSNCKLISDTVFCAFTSSSWPCGDSGMTCLDFANRSLGDYMDTFELISKNYRYLFEITTYEYCFMDEEGCMMLRFGDESLKDYTGGRIKTANYAIQKSMEGNPLNLKVRLYVARRLP